MEFNSIEFSGFRPFLDRCAFDFDSIPGRIVSLEGANGSGKTRFLELLRGAIYRTMPTRGKVNALAADRKSILSVTITTDKRYTLKQIVDGGSGKAEAVVLDALGAPLTDSGKLTEFDAWVAEHLPDEDLLSATSFSPQGEKGFFGLSKADRKKVMLRALRIEHYEALAEEARERLRAAKGDLEHTLARYNELSAGALAVDSAREALNTATEEATAAEVTLKEARAALTRVNALAVEADKVIEANRQLRLQREALTTRITDAETRRAVIDDRTQTANVVLARQREIEDAVAQVAAIDAEITAMQSSLEAKQTELAVASTNLATANADRKAAIDRRDAANTKVLSLRLRLKEADTVKEAVRRLPELETELTAAAAETKAAFVALRALQGTALLDAGERIVNLRAGHETIRDYTPSDLIDDIERLKETSRATLTADDDAVAQVAALPEKLRTAAAFEQEKGKVEEAKQREVEQVRTTAARLAEIEQAGSDLTEQARVAESATVDIAELDTVVEQAGSTVRTLTEERNVLNTQRAALTDKKLKHSDIAGLQVQLEQAKTRKDELETQHAEVDAEILKLIEERRIIIVGEDPETVDTRNEEIDVSIAETVAAETLRAKITASAALDAAEKIATRLANLESQRLAEELEVSDWTRLAFELGRDGLQALEIDAAGPELTELTNDLLHNCFGSRYTVQIETTTPKKDGKGEKEVFDGIVYDSQEGPKTFEQLSGGQEVIVGEAVSLALTMIACRRSGVKSPTLVRDETGAALDGENGVAYVAMLRRAADIVGASRVIFVTHNRELHSLADANLHVEKGVVSLRNAA